MAYTALLWHGSAMFDVAPLLTGFALSTGLIIAIGAQNVFVLRQGLRREHVGPVVAFCAIADFALIGAGVAGLGAPLTRLPELVNVFAIGAAAFLAGYGLRALRRSARPSRLVAGATGAGLTLGGALAQVAGLTLLNPHVSSARSARRCHRAASCPSSRARASRAPHGSQRSASVPASSRRSSRVRWPGAFSTSRLAWSCCFSPPVFSAMPSGDRPIMASAL
jgi:hypothetical protein